MVEGVSCRRLLVLSYLRDTVTYFSLKCVLYSSLLKCRSPGVSTRTEASPGARANSFPASVAALGQEEVIHPNMSNWASKLNVWIAENPGTLLGHSKPKHSRRKLMFLQVQSVVGPGVASTLHHGLNAANPWLQSLSRSKQGLPYLYLPMEAPTGI